MRGRIVALLEDPDWPAMAALVDGGRLIDLRLDAPEQDATPRLEAVHRARVTRKAPNIGAVFLDLGDGLEGFLKGGKHLSPGDRPLVQIARFAEGGKAVPVTDEPLFKGRYAILTPHAPGVNVSRRIKDEAERDRLQALAVGALAEAGLAAAGPEEETAPGAIVRSAAEDVEADAVAEDVASLAALWAEAQDGGDAPGLRVDGPDAEVLAWRDWTDPEPEQVLRGDARLWDDLGLLDQVEALSTPRAALPGGGFVLVEPTSALVAVDVNTGGDLSPAAGLKANLAAAEALPRQLLLRGLGGQIVLDLAPMGKRERPKFEAALKKALRADPVDTQVVGWTPLGHLELTRRRERRPLAELLPKR
ncbi:MAG: ribonuclease E/G [Pseudomonadota bacterium]